MVWNEIQFLTRTLYLYILNKKKNQDKEIFSICVIESNQLKLSYKVLKIVAYISVSITCELGSALNAISDV